MHLVTRTPAMVLLHMEIVRVSVHIKFPKIVKLVQETMSPLVGMRKSQTKLKLFSGPHLNPLTYVCKIVKNPLTPALFKP